VGQVENIIGLKRNLQVSENCKWVKRLKKVGEKDNSGKGRWVKTTTREKEVIEK